MFSRQFVEILIGIGVRELFVLIFINARQFRVGQLGIVLCAVFILSRVHGLVEKCGKGYVPLAGYIHHGIIYGCEFRQLFRDTGSVKNLLILPRLLQKKDRI